MAQNFEPIKRLMSKGRPCALGIETGDSLLGKELELL